MVLYAITTISIECFIICNPYLLLLTSSETRKQWKSWIFGLVGVQPENKVSVTLVKEKSIPKSTDRVAVSAKKSLHA